MLWEKYKACVGMDFTTKKTLLFACTFVLLLSGISIFYIQSVSVTSFIGKISQQCERPALEERQACLKIQIHKYVSEHPKRTRIVFDSLWDALRDQTLEDDARIFSPIVHDVGMSLVRQGYALEDAVRLCGLSFRGGCIHGFIMESIDSQKGQIMPSKILEECEVLRTGVFRLTEDLYGNCIHAIGHVFASHATGSLSESVSLCNIVDVTNRDSCVFGVLMEYSKGEAGSGHHSENPVGGKEYDCSLLDTSSQKACYISMGFYKQYEANSEPLETTYRSCERLPIQHREDCFTGIGGAILFSNAFVYKKTSALCESLPDDVRTDCLDSIRTQ